MIDKPLESISDHNTFSQVPHGSGCASHSDPDGPCIFGLGCQPYSFGSNGSRSGSLGT
nr:hypothetical protein Iba_chr02fCG2800 [Ipomoea batatas]